MTKIIESLDELAELKSLLTAAGLPVSDLFEGSAQKFFGIRIGPKLAACAGVECYGGNALLRSVAILPAYRNQGLACALVRHTEGYAAGLGVTSLYLLTTTAEGFFMRLGYAPTSRESAPAAIAASTQFSALCPASSAFLKKSIASPVHQ